MRIKKGVFKKAVYEDYFFKIVAKSR